MWIKMVKSSLKLIGLFMHTEGTHTIIVGFFFYLFIVHPYNKYHGKICVVWDLEKSISIKNNDFYCAATTRPFSLYFILHPHLIKAQKT